MSLTLPLAGIIAFSKNLSVDLIFFLSSRLIQQHKEDAYEELYLKKGTFAPECLRKKLGFVHAQPRPPQTLTNITTAWCKDGKTWVLELTPCQKKLCLHTL